MQSNILCAKCDFLFPSSRYVRFDFDQVVEHSFAQPRLLVGTAVHTFAAAAASGNN
jgi:hypothetical protein